MNNMITFEYLQKEIVAAEQALEENEQEFLDLEDDNDDNNENQQQQQQRKEPVWVQLSRLEQTSTDLELAQQIAKWVQQSKKSSSSSSSNDNDIFLELEHYEALAKLLGDHASSSSSSSLSSSELFQRLYQEEYIPWHQYIKGRFIVELRLALKRNHYPTNTTTMNTTATSTVAQYCTALSRIATIHQQTIRHVEQFVPPAELNDAVLELCRPFVERVKYHFVPGANTMEPRSSSNSTTTNTTKTSMTLNRMDRLPEWLCSYVREHIFESNAWDFVTQVLSSTERLDFLNEVVRMVQWVLSERNFFRHPTIAGPQSKPVYLCNAIQELLQFDDYIQGLVLSSSGGGVGGAGDNKNHETSVAESKRIVRIFDVCITGDEELLSWWLERERESVFDILFGNQNDDDDDDDDEEEEKAEQHSKKCPLPVFPRAELFCALMRSIQIKSAVFQFSGPYLSDVASPVCMQFIDAIQETAQDLKKPLKKRGALPTVLDLQRNTMAWIELINGTHMATMILDEENADLARFKKSLERLEEALVEEFVKNVVDTLLMERAKMAGYVMRCSHFLALSSFSDQESSSSSNDIVSLDLQDAIKCLHAIVSTCQTVMDDDTNSHDVEFADVAQFAPRKIQELLWTELSTHLLGVALNLDGMTPDLCLAGAKQFLRDVQALLGNYVSLPVDALRLLDVAKVMSLHDLASIGDALCGLSGATAPLTEDIFDSDSRLFDEAISMIRAKGYAYIELSDVLEVLNRRRDL